MKTLLLRALNSLDQSRDLQVSLRDIFLYGLVDSYGEMFVTKPDPARPLTVRGFPARVSLVSGRVAGDETLKTWSIKNKL